VAVAHAVYRPTEAEVAYYQGMLDAFAESEKLGIAAVRYHGAMVDYAMLPLAREVVADAARYSSPALAAHPT
jgi:citrate lyase subunit beta/citryl-CoA lyase